MRTQIVPVMTTRIARKFVFAARPLLFAAGLVAVSVPTMLGQTNGTPLATRAPQPKAAVMLAQAAAPPAPAAPQSPDTTAPTPPNDAPMYVPPEVIAGNLISSVDPVYPPVAKAAHVEGVVILRATISRTGSIQNLKVVTGRSMLLSSALAAVQQWKYKPYILDGQPVEVSTTINVNFSLADKPAATSPPDDDRRAAIAQADQNYRDLLKELGGIAPKNAGGPVSSPTLIDSVPPKLTPEAKKAKVAGTVLLGLVVDQNGRPLNVHVLRGFGIGRGGALDQNISKEVADAMDQSAIDAVKQYKFRPAMEGDKPVPVLLDIEVDFQLH